jgi:hypothetical protein
MIRHIVMWKLKDEAEGASREENARKMKEMLEGLPGRIAEIRSLEVGINQARSPDAFDAVLVSEFAHWEDLRRYMEHPAHQRVSEFVGRVRLERRIVDFES